MPALAISKSLLEAVRGSQDRTSLEALFKKRKISSKKQRIDIMLKAMEISAVNYACSNPSIGEKYEIIVGSFLTGFWRRDFYSWRNKKTNDESEQEISFEG